MKKFFKIVCTIFMLMVVTGQFSYGLEFEPIYTAPPVRPTATPIPLQTLSPPPFQTYFPQITPMPFNTPANPEPLDLTITDVFKEFVSTGISGTYYKYYIWVERTGGDLSATSIPLKISAYYGYSGFGEQNTINLQVSFCQGETIGVATEIININPLSHYQYPSLYSIFFMIDPDNSIEETDENNNTWSCDSVADDCAGCIGQDCYP